MFSNWVVYYLFEKMSILILMTAFILSILPVEKNLPTAENCHKRRVTSAL